MSFTKTQFFAAFGLIIKAPIPIKGLKKVKETDRFDIEIVFDTIQNIPETEPTKVKRKGLSASFGSDSAADYLVWENEISFKLSNGTLMVVDTEETDVDFLSLFIVSEPLGMLLFQRGDLLLHGSAIRINGHSSIIFVGEPGMGKSTTAAAFVKAGCKIISDDLVAIRIIDQKPYVIPSFPQIKIWKKSVDGLGYDYSQLEKIVEGTNKFAYYNENIFDERPAGLSKLYVITNEEEPGQVSEIHTPIELLKYFALPEQLIQSGVPMQEHFQQSLQIASHIAIEKIEKMPDFAYLENFVKERLK